MLEPQSAPHSSRLVAAARELSEHHALSDLYPRPLPAWSHIRAMSDWLVRARASAATPPPEASKAAEWLLDNDYQIERAIFQIRQDLPGGFYRRLPALAGEEDQGLPRVFVLAHGLLQAAHLQLSQSAAIEFVNAYQEKAPLTIAELWALPTMLRLASQEILASAFGSLFPELWMPFAPTRHAAMTGPFENTECVSRSIINLGVISSIQWKEFFEQTSRVEAHLRQDPAGIYPRMDLETRDYYRKAVEDLADRSGRAEWLVAEEVMAKSAPINTAWPRNHIGFWLIGDGRWAIGIRKDYSVPHLSHCPVVPVGPAPRRSNL